MNDVAKFQRQPTMPTPPPKTRHQMHPAALEAAAVYSDALTQVDELRSENAQLQMHLEAARRHVQTLEQRLDREVHQKETFQRYSIELRSHLEGIGKTIELAVDSATRAAETLPSATKPQTIADAVNGMARDLDAKH